MKHGKRKVNPANIYPILINNDIEHELIKQSHQKANIVSLDLKKKKNNPQDPTISCLQEIYFRFKKTNRLKVKG